MTRDYTEKELELVKRIVNDKYAVGGFSGMIFNAIMAHPDVTIDEAIQKALQVRLKLEQVATEEVEEKKFERTEDMI